MGKFENKVVVVTGGNSGIGLATAKGFIAEGAKVIITGRRKDAIEQAAKDTGAVAVKADQANLQEIDQLVAQVQRDYGKADVLVINAGIAAFFPIVAATEQHFDDVLNTNFKGAFFTLQKFIPILNEGASVVMISSNSASMHRPNSAVYSASKVALNMLMKTAAVELVGQKIRVNTVSPGPTATEIVKKLGLDEETAKNMILPEIPLGKLGAAEDVAQMVLHLSDDSVASFITGAEFIIDGGMSV
ncbi:SDR family oxidoreductase [Chitinophaga filiformis]|uniref:NAD(P)-dependent dehydrogenase, short-chain alcohol dehydrogenase family n=1 Tax=Chitinophaga filiformis TaxID=104663 RepID=A0A1G7M7H3_CHIFI|nr:SDR family oxidoreductase [Chitinophaga filiformis]SDF57594.1 NAD(P)-dependent dehydrogenase, short-chain alcohol dehydrogenase family [Chitinophaga filiformis]